MVADSEGDEESHAQRTEEELALDLLAEEDEEHLDLSYVMVCVLPCCPSGVLILNF